MNEFDVTEETTQQETSEDLDFSSVLPWYDRFRLPIVIAAAVIVLGGGGWWAFNSGIFSGGDVTEVEVSRRDRTEALPIGQVYPLSDLIINPSAGRRHFIVSIGLEVADPDRIPEIQAREPLLRDNLLTLFSAQPVEVLTNIKYRQALRSRVKAIMDYQLGVGLVERVFFEKWVFQ